MMYMRRMLGCIVQCTSNFFADEEPTITAPDPYVMTELNLRFRLQNG
jgi:hypothetical protein